MENPNQYNDERFESSANSLTGALQGMWEAGAKLEDIETTAADALSDALGKHCSVEIGYPA